MPWASDLQTAAQMVKDGKVPALLLFVENSAQLSTYVASLTELWSQKVNFWIFYPKKPHLGTDLSRDVTWKLLKQHGISGTRQVAISDQWSCMYFKNTGKDVMPGRA